MGVLSKTTDFFFNKLYSFISHINLSDTINYFDKSYEGNYITFTSDGRNKIYGVCLETTSNITKEFVAKSTDKNGNLFLAILKKDGIAKIYAFSTSNLLLLDIAEKFDVKLLNPDELISALYSIFLIDTFKIEDKRVINIYENAQNNVIDNDPLHIIFPQMIKNATANLLHKYQAYQAVNYDKPPKYSVVNLLNAEWEGVIYFFLDFGGDAVKELMNRYERSAKLIDGRYLKKLKELKAVENTEALNEIYSETAIINSIVLVKNHIQLHNIETQLRIKYEPRYLNLDRILPKTMLRSRDIDFDFLAPREWATQLISSALQKDALELANLGGAYPIVDFCGTDIQGNFVNYTFKQSLNPHCLVFGTTGAGKSVSVLKILAQLIDFDFETKRATKLSETRKIRYSNVGYTGGRIFKAIEEQSKAEGSNLMQKMNSNIGNLRFSLFDFDDDIPSEDEIKSLLAFLNLLLGFEEKTNAMSELEQTAFREALVNTCQDYATNGSTVTVLELKNNRFGDSYLEFVDEILKEKDENGNLLYDEITPLSQLSDKYKRFKRPTLGDLISQVKILGNAITKTKEEKEAASSLQSKLNQLNQNKLYSYYSNVDLKANTPLYYAEFDRIKEHTKDFVSIGWLLITTWFKKDKEEALRAQMNGNLRPDSYYIVDEAHNFLKQPKFKDLFDVWSREMRKYGCHLILMTQSTKDIAVETADFFATKFFIFSHNNKGEAYEQLLYLNGGKELDAKEKHIFDMIDNSAKRNRTLFMRHSGGTTALKLPEHKEYSEYFQPFDF
ncbi:type IV secretory system conjugative DNA transfer family protein [Campylobacter sp. JMF_01 NE2]|uniref:hypothetical protein n=1 Tax=unclassified Campylobacter TaxID=2593542 RepID=UPI0022EA06DF|nr:MULTISPECIES: hypothetical protein [unclassified Campylobacter]MDA3053322.1 type IV secretory system conjugative DNA transfer family protein [Campylobacter sp. JMF_03 NE3]MDA3067658.1 type IV secretory system conjugative DNA transfer family protein [Campylobacter sp. JMF_01 NE2]